MFYKGYKIEKISPNTASVYATYGHKWGVYAENHGVNFITGRSYVTWRLVYSARTQEECKRGINAHFGRL